MVTTSQQNKVNYQKILSFNFLVDASISEKVKKLPSLIPRILQAKSPRDESVHASKGKSQTSQCYSAGKLCNILFGQVANLNERDFNLISYSKIRTKRQRLNSYDDCGADNGSGGYGAPCHGDNEGCGNNVVILMMERMLLLKIMVTMMTMLKF